MNTQALKDAVAHWETYQDRGVKPLVQSLGEAGYNRDGNASALGDIEFYSGLAHEGVAWHRRMTTIHQFLDPEGCSNSIDFYARGSYAVESIALENNASGEWPIAHVKRLVAQVESAVLEAVTA